jgi:O-antigen ligase
MEKFRFNCGKINSYLIIVLILSFPFSVALGSIFSAFIFIFFLLNSNFKEQFSQLKDNKIAIAFLLFIALHIIALSWTQDMEWGIRVVKKQWKFLLIPIFMIYVKREYLNYYIYSFVASMLFSAFISYLIWFGFIEPFGVSTVQDPTPFMSHVTYNPLLSFSIYLIGVKFILNKDYSFMLKSIHLFSFIFMVINMFITGGRTGHIMFFLVIIIL